MNAALPCTTSPAVPVNNYIAANGPAYFGGAANEKHHEIVVDAAGIPSFSGTAATMTPSNVEASPIVATNNAVSACQTPDMITSGSPSSPAGKHSNHLHYSSKFATRRVREVGLTTVRQKYYFNTLT